MNVSREEIAPLGEKLYAERIRPQVEEGNKGKFIVIDVETGEYELDRNDIAAWKRAYAKRTEPALYMTRIGYPAAYNMGSYWPKDGA